MLNLASFFNVFIGDKDARMIQSFLNKLNNVNTPDMVELLIQVLDYCNEYKKIRIDAIDDETISAVWNTLKNNSCVIDCIANKPDLQTILFNTVPKEFIEHIINQKTPFQKIHIEKLPLQNDEQTRTLLRKFWTYINDGQPSPIIPLPLLDEYSRIGFHVDEIIDHQTGLSIMFTLLHYNSATLDRVCKSGVDLNRSEGVPPRTLLQYALDNDLIESAKMLLANGAIPTNNALLLSRSPQANSNTTTDLNKQKHTPEQ